MTDDNKIKCQLSFTEDHDPNRRDKPRIIVGFVYDKATTMSDVLTTSHIVLFKKCCHQGKP